MSAYQDRASTVLTSSGYGSSFFTIIFLLVAQLGSTSAVAATAYISDELTVPLRSGPSGSHRIVHRGLPSGTKMDVLNTDEDAGFSQIITDRGTEGWVRSQYLVTQPIAKHRLAAAQAAQARAESRLRGVQDKVKELSSSNQSQAGQAQQDQSKITQLETELAEIKRISAGAVEAHENNLALQESNARLRDELDDLAEERDRLESNVQNQGILYGAGLLLIGLIAGVLIKARPQRSAWS